MKGKEKNKDVINSVVIPALKSSCGAMILSFLLGILFAQFDIYLSFSPMTLFAVFLVFHGVAYTANKKR